MNFDIVFDRTVDSVTPGEIFLREGDGEAYIGSDEPRRFGSVAKNEYVCIRLRDGVVCGLQGDNKVHKIWTSLSGDAVVYLGGWHAGRLYEQRLKTQIGGVNYAGQ